MWLLHVAWGSSQHGGRVLRVSILKERYRKRQKPNIALYYLASEVTQHHFCTVWDSYKACLGSRKGDIDPNGGMSVSFCKKRWVMY